MPRKNCCCNIVPPVVGSCCRPIYNGCIGKTYEFSFQFSVKYPCTKSNGSPMIYKCDNNDSITYDIPGNFETYEITCLYTIERPAELRASPACFTPPSLPSISCGSWACQGSGFDPKSPSTWRRCENDGFGNYTIPCTRCDCYTSSNYSYCNFDTDKLKTSCNCNTGFIPFLYRCTLDGSIESAIDGSNPTPCGTDGFGNPRPFTLIQEGNEELLDLWSACYRFYEIKQNDFGFTNFGCGCTFEPGSKNLLDSYNVQFIPNPSIPEQSNPNYQPRIIIDLINFEFQCTADGGGPFNNFPPPGYDISFSLGIGYRQDFNCGGTTNNPVIETLYIPFKICEDFFGGVYYDGLYIEGRFNRSSFTTDPFDLCIPPSTTTFVKNNSGGRCTSEIFYSDSYTQWYENSSIGSAGILYRNDTGIVNCPVLMGDVCDTGAWDSSIPDSVYCNFLRFTNKILVSEV
tara:strand:+ start:254 stop:1627 length:1374 start_codon:yes stop_codon:yes gene_type:complete